MPNAKAQAAAKPLNPQTNRALAQPKLSNSRTPNTTHIHIWGFPSIRASSLGVLIITIVGFRVYIGASLPDVSLSNFALSTSKTRVYVNVVDVRGHAALYSGARVFTWPDCGVDLRVGPGVQHFL